MNPQSDPPFSLNKRLLDSRNDILEILGSLVIVTSKGDSTCSDDDSDDILDNISDNDSKYLSAEKIRLAHFSVKDYLVSTRIQYSKAEIF